MRILEFDYGFDKRTDSICFLWSLDNNSQLHNLLLIRRSFWHQLSHIQYYRLVCLCIIGRDIPDSCDDIFKWTYPSSA